MQWKASVSHPWIRLSKMNGQLFPDSGKSQVRLWVDIDWKNINKKESVPGSITITGGGKQIVLSLSASNPAILQLANYKGFVENNGFVSIHANHFNRQNSQQAKQWKVIPGLGYTENAIQAFPLTVEGNVTTDLDAMKKNGTFVAYDFYNFTETNPSVTIFALPTHPINNNYQVRYAVSIDDGPLKMVNIRTVGRSEEWKQNVLRNRAERKIEMPFLKTGKHQLKIFCVDPGVIVDEIRIDLGGLKKAYRTLPETYIKKL